MEAPVPRFLRRSLGSEEAAGIVRRRRASREDDFLAVVRRAAYGHPASPYGRLLRLAGCE